MVTCILLYSEPFLTKQKKFDINKKKVIPITANIIKSQFGNFDTERDKNDVYIMFINVNYIWRNSNINFDVIEIKERILSQPEIEKIIESGNILEINKNNDNELNAYFMNNLGPVNGFAIPPKNMLFVSDETKGNDASVLAHELGHIFGLEHSDEKEEIMFNYCGGTELNDDQVLFLNNFTSK